LKKEQFFAHLKLKMKTLFLCDLVSGKQLQFCTAAFSKYIMIHPQVCTLDNVSKESIGKFLVGNQSMQNYTPLVLIQIE